MKTIAIGLMWMAACGSAATHTQTAAVAERRDAETAMHDWASHHGDVSPGYALRFTHAQLPARRPNGAAWHLSPSDNAPLMLGELAGFAIGNPTLGTTIGKALSTSGGEPLAPAPYVVLKVAGATYAIAPTQRSYAPSWDQPIAIYRRSLRDGDRAVVQVIDAIDGSLIGQKDYTFAELVARPSQTLTNLDAVATLDLEVAALPQRFHEELWITIPSDRQLSTLLRDPPANWRPISVWNGDEVTIEATGRVCPANRSDDCVGPDGVSGQRWRRYNYDDLANLPHASLVGILPGSAFEIGTRRRFRVASSGGLLLFVNDTDVGNNRGEFVAHVIVEPHAE